jgi:hypothetical protein
MDGLLNPKKRKPNESAGLLGVEPQGNEIDRLDQLELLFTSVPEYANSPEAPMILDEIQKTRFSLFGGGGSIPSGFAFGGRLGADIPLSQDSSLGLGMAGSVVNAQDFKNKMLTGLDATYRKGPSSYGVELRKAFPGGIFDGRPVGGNPDQLWFRYGRQF